MNNYNEEVEAQMRGRQLIDHAVRVEYQERYGENMLYLGWLLGAIKSYNKRKGYIIEFKNQKHRLGRETGDSTDWIPSINSPDVKIL